MEGTKILSTCFSKSTGFIAANYSFHALASQHAKAALQLLSREFESQQPLSNAFYRVFPLEKEVRVQKWTNFWKFFEQDYLTNGISVGCFDMNNGDELVGISVAKDLNFIPEGFEEQYMKQVNFMSSIIKFQEKMLAQVEPKYQPILAQTGMVMDIWGVAIKKEHMGKRLLHKMMGLNERLGAQKNYQYSFSYASNFKTGVALQKQNFHKISSLDAKQFQIDGVRVYQQIEDLHRCPSLFLKKIDLEERL